MENGNLCAVNFKCLGHGFSVLVQVFFILVRQEKCVNYCPDIIKHGLSVLKAAVRSLK